MPPATGVPAWRRRSRRCHATTAVQAAGLSASVLARVYSGRMERADILKGLATGQSGTALARLVLDPELAGVTGKYFSGRRETRSSAESYDLDKAADLWETSIALVGS